MGGQWVATGIKDKQAAPAPDEAKRPTKRAPTTVANSSLLIYGNSRTTICRAPCGLACSTPQFLVP